MTRIKYDINLLKYITLFESLTGAKVKDCFIAERIVFVVDKGQIGLAIGKGGANLRRVERALKKQIKVVEFDDDVGKFVKNFVYPLWKFRVALNEKEVVIEGEDTKTKGLLIGRERVNLNKLTEVVKRYFDVDKISVV